MTLNKKTILFSPDSEKSRFSPKARFLFLAISGIIISVLICVVIYFLLSNIKKDSKTIISQKEEMALLQEKLRNLRQFEESYQANRENLEKIDTLFFDSEVPEDLKKFADFLRKTVQDSQILIGEEIPPPSPKKQMAVDPWPFVTFQLSCKGSLSNFARFLEKLEAASYLIEISNLTMKRLTETGLKSTSPETLAEGQALSLGDISADLSIKVFTR